MKKRVALYPGTFDPITNGHLDIIGRAVKLYDKLVIGVARNDAKNPLFSFDERVEMARELAESVAGDTEIEVTAREFAILQVLLRQVGDVVSKREILEGVWDLDFEGDTNIVEVYVSSLRKKIDAPFGRASLETVRGMGYRLNAEGG